MTCSGNTDCSSAEKLMLLPCGVEPQAAWVLYSLFDAIHHDKGLHCSSASEQDRRGESFLLLHQWLDPQLPRSCDLNCCLA